jgi:hypothetical protein
LNEKGRRRTVVLSDDLAVDVRDPEESRKDRNDGAGSDNGTGNGGSGQLVETKVGSTLVDNGHGADGGSDEEEAAGRPGEDQGSACKPSGVETVERTYKGPAMKTARIESSRVRTQYLAIRKRIAPKPAEIPGAMMKPAKMVASPFPPFQPHWTASTPPTATPTPARAETIE